MQGVEFAAEGDEPLYVVEMDRGYGVISQINERGEAESIATNSARLRAVADYLDGAAALGAKNTDPGSELAA